MSEKITRIYLAAPLYFESPDQMFESLPDKACYAHIETMNNKIGFFFNRDDAIEDMQIQNRNRDPHLNSYLYSALVDIEDNFIDFSKPFPDQYKEPFETLLSHELSLLRSAEDIKIFFRDPFWRQSPQQIIREMERLFSPEKAIKLLLSIGIRGYVHSENGRKKIEIFDYANIQDFRRKALSRVKVEAFYGGGSDIRSAEDYIDFYFTPHFNNKVGLYNMHALKYDRAFRAVFLQYLQQHTPEFTELDLKNYIAKLLLKKEFNHVVTTGFETSQRQIPIPQTQDELQDYRPPRNGDVHSAENICIERTNGTIKLLVNQKNRHKIICKTAENTDHIRAEYEAYRIYQAFNVKVPACSLVQNGEETLLLLEYIEGRTMEELTQNSFYYKDVDVMKADRNQIAQDFAIDVLLGNPDTGYFHLENLIRTKDGEIYRIDMGFCLSYHAEGMKKDDFAIGDFSWDKSIYDFHKMRYYGKGRHHFGGITNQQIYDRLCVAKKCMKAVKKVASEENYSIIATRLEKALKHFGELTKVEQEFRENGISITGQTKRPETQTRPDSKINELIFN